MAHPVEVVPYSAQLRRLRNRLAALAVRMTKVDDAERQLLQREAEWCAVRTRHYEALQSPLLPKPVADPPVAKPERKLTVRRQGWRRPNPASRRKSCLRKHAFSQDRALRQAKRRRDETGLPIYAYPCRFCSEWHIGKPSRDRIAAGA